MDTKEEDDKKSDDFKKVEFNVITYKHFNEMVEEYLGFEYDCVAEEEYNNFSCYSYENMKRDVANDKFYIDYSLPDIESNINGDNEYRPVGVRALLIYMVCNGFAPEGNYLIEVSW